MVDDDDDAGPFGSMVPDFSGMAEQYEQPTAPTGPYQTSMFPMAGQEERASRDQAAATPGPANRELSGGPDFDSRQQSLPFGDTSPQRTQKQPAQSQHDAQMALLHAENTLGRRKKVALVHDYLRI